MYENILIIYDKDIKNDLLNSNIFCIWNNLEHFIFQIYNDNDNDNDSDKDNNDNDNDKDNDNNDDNNKTKVIVKDDIGKYYEITKENIKYYLYIGFLWL